MVYYDITDVFKVLMLIRQMRLKNILYVTIGIS